MIVALLRESFIQLLHSLLPFRLHRFPVERKTTTRLRSISRHLSPLLLSEHRQVAVRPLGGDEPTELLVRSPLLARDYAHHSALMSGWKARGRPYGVRAIVLAMEFDDLLVRGFSFCHTGIGMQASARYAEGIPKLTEAISAYEKAGDLWELHLARFHRGCCHFGLGNLAKALAEARWVFASAARLGDSRTMCCSWLFAALPRRHSLRGIEKLHPAPT